MPSDSGGFGAAEFAEIGRTVAAVAGVQIGPGKEGLVRSRLARRLRELGVATVAEYVARVRDDASGRERDQMVDLLTTNTTHFFREPAHFDVVRDGVVPAFGGVPGGLRVWSAGCATGEEAYTLAMVLRGAVPDVDRRPADAPRVLATDLSCRALAVAAHGVYARARVVDVPTALLREHFDALPDDAWTARPALRAVVRFARLNLMDLWPMRGPFHAIFCRNVMIYFDKPTQQTLVSRLHVLLAPGGFLFVGHAESLTGLTHGFTYVRPAVYRK